MADNKVKFLRGTSDEYAVAEKDNDTIYFTTDDGKLYIGDKEISGSDITIDDALSDTSTNPVQNKAVKAELDKKADITDIPTSLPANGGNADMVNGHSVNADVPENAVFTDTITAGENLLINPDFKINQREKTGTVYPLSTPGKFDRTYFVDRWSIDSGYVTINSDGTLFLDGTISQVLEESVGENVVASASAGTVTYDDSTKTFSISATSSNISWAKLEYGNVATAFISPNISTEQLKCQRYYLGLNTYIRYPMTRRTSSDIDFIIPANAMFRTVPTLLGTPIVYDSINAIAQTGFTFTVTAIGINAVVIRATKANHGLTLAYLDMTKGVNLDAEI